MDPKSPKYHGTFYENEIVSLSPKEILDKFGKMFFSNDEDYKLWCRERVGGNEGIHKISEDKNEPTDPDSLRS